MGKKITVFGAGLVSKPMVDYLAGHNFEVTICDIVLEKAEALAAPHKNVIPARLDVNDDSVMEDLIKNSDMAVSLLPATMHPLVAKKCIELKKHMVTASYISPQMLALDEKAKAAGVSILNEIGVDPGLDHMSAMKIFHEVEEKGGKIVSFKSYCGGLPAQEANTNPLGYKFSWAPRGVLKAASNNARYLKDGNIVEVPGKNLFGHYWLVDVPGAGCFEAYANRDSLSYIEKYDLKHVRTMYRGTFRNISHCDTWWAFSQLNFFSEEPYHKNLTGTVREYILTKMLGENTDADLEAILSDKLGIRKESVVFKKFGWLGFFDETPIPITEGAPIDVLTALMLEKMPYEDGERDLLILHHEFVAEFDGKEQRITSTLIDYGIPGGDTSMARTVALPAAIGVRLIMEGKISRKGVFMPKYKEIYEPVLAELDTLGIKIVEKYY